MPELPEVETMRRDLERMVGPAEISQVQVFDPKVVVGEVSEFVAGLEGRRFTRYDRRGKVIILHLDNHQALLVHPRMTGRFFAQDEQAPRPRHARVTIHLAGGRRMVFDDSRRFGRLELLALKQGREAVLLRNIGPDALACDCGYLKDQLRRRRIPVKMLLLDQKVLAGVGNIYASEILHRCGLDPRTPCHRVQPREVADIARETERVLAEGVAHRGTTISDYLAPDGQPGGFQKRLRVYGREGERCLREGCQGTIRRIVLGGRSTYYCSHCQRTGRRRLS